MNLAALIHAFPALCGGQNSADVESCQATVDDHLSISQSLQVPAIFSSLLFLSSPAYGRMPGRNLSDGLSMTLDPTFGLHQLMVTRTISMSAWNPCSKFEGQHRV
jgi:hypothetical protein